MRIKYWHIAGVRENIIFSDGKGGGDFGPIYIETSAGNVNRPRTVDDYPR
jgi:hypothetical protein